MNNSNQMQADIAERAQLASAVAALTPDTHALSLWLDTDDAPEGLDIHQLTVAEDQETITFRLTNGQPWPATWLAARVTLCARNDLEFLRFQGLEALALEDGDGAQALRCTLPERVVTINQRQTVRMPIIDGLHTTATLHVFADQQPIQARLLDLSAEGCLVEMPIGAGMLFTPDQPVTELSIEGPDGDRIAVKACVRHIRATERGPLARVGLEFVNIAFERKQKLWTWLRGIEREIALRTGGGGRMMQDCAQFTAPAAPEPSAEDALDEPQKTPMVHELDEVAGRLGAAVIALRNNRPLPVDALNDCANTLCELLESDRQCFLYALCCLHEHPPLLQHSIAVAGKLADLMRVDDGLAQDMRPAALAALIHDLGKAMLVDQSLPADGILSERQKHRIREHVNVLIEQLDASDWLAASARHDIIESINERLDGSGYPYGLDASQLGPVSRAASVVDVIDAMTRARGDRPAFTPMAAYRELYNQPECFDRQWVTRYIQRHGMYPIGSLVRYSGGFLAWVMALDDKAQPACVRLVRNLAGRERPMNEVLEGRHIAQLGKLEGPVDAQEYGLAPF